MPWDGLGFRICGEGAESAASCHYGAFGMRRRASVL